MSKPDEPAHADQPYIHIFMEGGIIQNISKYKVEGIKITVYDYDVEDVDIDRLTLDAKGDECIISEW